jgi:hypothetical protein
MNYIPKLSIIIVLRVTQYIDKIIGIHHCGFQCNRLTVDHVFCMCKMSEMECEYGGQYVSYL